MTTKTTERAVAAQPPTRMPAHADYSNLKPLPDPPKEFDMQQHMRINTFEGTIKPYFKKRSDVLICGSGYLRREATNEAERLAPDCVVAMGVNPRAIVNRNGYVISEVGKPPDFVLEVASESTGRRDYTVKRDGYAGYGVREYWRFDRTGGRFHDVAIAGDTLVDGGYARLPIVEEPDGRLWGYSEVLGLELWWDDGEIRVRDPVTGEFLLTPEELDWDREAERVARVAAEERAEAAEARIEELAAELRWLRGE